MHYPLILFVNYAIVTSRNFQGAAQRTPVYILASFASAHSSRFSLPLGVAPTPTELDIDWEAVYPNLAEVFFPDFSRFSRQNFKKFPAIFMRQFWIFGVRDRCFSQGQR